MIPPTEDKTAGTEYAQQLYGTTTAYQTFRGQPRRLARSWKIIEHRGVAKDAALKTREGQKVIASDNGAFHTMKTGTEVLTRTVETF